MNARNLAFLEDESLLVDGFSGYSWSALLAYFQNRTHVSNFSLSNGSEKHVANAECVLANEFNFNNEKYTLGESFDWQTNPSQDLEWLILLHKFYYLKDLAGAYDYTQDERYAAKWVDLINSWISQVPNGFIDSQVAGRRLQQWILSYQTFVTQCHSPSVTPDFFGRFIHSINSQTHYLCEHLTPEGNHRTLELYAIFLVAVTFPELNSAEWFLGFSKQKLVENIRQDLLPDGVHRELSTDYHHTVLKNYLRFRGLALLNNIGLPAQCDELLKKAIAFSYYAHKPDGFIPAINDGDCNSYLPLLKKANTCYPDSFLQYVLNKGEDGIAPVQRSRGFTESGYYILRSDWAKKPYGEALYLFFDCAPLGFGSHGHYDALNFEMAAYGYSLIVDPGRYTYSEISGDGVNWRQYFKGTAAHNAVVVDGLDQMPYRCGRPTDPEPQVTLKQFVSTSGFDLLQGQVACHQYPAIHERTIFFLLPEYWIVTDRLMAEENHNYDLYFHLSNRAQNQTSLVSNDVCHVIHSPNLLIAQPYCPDTKVVIEQGYVSPEYGIKHPAPVVRFSKQQASTTAFHTMLYPFKDEPPTIAVTQLPVYKNGSLCDESEVTALHIKLGNVEPCFEDYFFINHGRIGDECTFADITCIAQTLFLRKNNSGQITNLQAEGIQFLSYSVTVLLQQLGGFSRLNYQDKTLVLTDPMTDKQMTEEVIDIYRNGYLHRGWEQQMTTTIIDPQFPQIAKILEPSYMLAALQKALFCNKEKISSLIKIESCSIGEKRYKPGKSFKLSYTLTLRELTTSECYEQVVTAQLNPIGASQISVGVCLENSADFPFDMPSVSYLPEANMMLWSFPYDRSLPHLPKLLNTKKLSAYFKESWPNLNLLVSECIASIQTKIMHYLPEQSCMIRYTLAIVEQATNKDSVREIIIYGKNYHDDCGVHTYAIMKQLADQIDHCAKPLHYDAETKTLWQAHVPGNPFEWTAILLENPSMVVRVAKCIGAFHSCVIEVDRQYGFTQISQQLESAVNISANVDSSLSKHVQDLVAEIFEVYRTLDWTGSANSSPLHLDLKMGNFLISDDKAFLVDMDSVCLGDPLVDTGSFIANLYLNGLRAGSTVGEIEQVVALFIDKYKATVASLVDDGKLYWYIAAALIHEVLRRSLRQQSVERIQHNATYIHLSHSYIVKCRAVIENE